MTKFSRLTLSAALLSAFALPAMASVPAQHRAPAKVHGTKAPVRHIAATGTTAGITTTVPAATVTSPVTAKPGVAVTAPTVTAPGVTAPAVTAPGVTSPAPSATLAAPAVTAKPAVKTN